jgi:hypothetical protein
MLPRSTPLDTPTTSPGLSSIFLHHHHNTSDIYHRDLKTDEHKSTGQSIHDKASRMTDTTGTTGTTGTTTTTDHKSVIDKVKDAIPGLHSDKRSDAAEVLDPNTTTTATDAVNKNL